MTADFDQQQAPERISAPANASEVRVAPTGDSSSPANPLLTLGRAYLFLNLFQAHAERRFKHSRPEARMQAMINEHKWFYLLCIWADFTVLVVAVVAAAIVAGFAIYKSFWL